MPLIMYPWQESLERIYRSLLGQTLSRQPGAMGDPPSGADETLALLAGQIQGSEPSSLVIPDTLDMQLGHYSGLVCENATGTASAQDLTGGADFVKINQWTGLLSQGGNVAGDLANDQVIVSENGIYFVDGQMSFSTNDGGGAATYHAQVFADGVVVPSLGMRRQLGAGSGGLGSASFMGFYDVSDQPVTLDLRVQIVEVGQDRDYHLQEGQLRVAKFARS